MITKRKYFKRISSQKVNSIFGIFLLILFLSFLGYLIYNNLKINQKKKVLTVQLEALKKEIQTLEEKKQKLESDISKQNKESFLESQARDRLGLKKPGEEVVMILPPPEKETTSVSSINSFKKFEEKTSNFFKKIFEKLKF